MAASEPYIETEIKLRYPAGAEAARRLIEQHGYREAQPRTLESDQLFDRPGGELRSSDQLLRLRRTGDRVTITYKGPGQRQLHKSREEIEFDVSDPGAFTRVLDRLGYIPGFRYEKYRTTFTAPGEPGFVTLDETPIGVFLELEGAAEWIDRAASRMGFTPAQYLTSSYGLLYREYLESHKGAPVNMVFDGGGNA